MYIYTIIKKYIVILKSFQYAQIINRETSTKNWWIDFDYGIHDLIITLIVGILRTIEMFFITNFTVDYQ